jgi:hypothetical protein
VFPLPSHTRDRPILEHRPPSIRLSQIQDTIGALKEKVDPDTSQKESRIRAISFKNNDPEIPTQELNTRSSPKLHRARSLGKGFSYIVDSVIKPPHVGLSASDNRISPLLKEVEILPSSSPPSPVVRRRSQTVSVVIKSKSQQNLMKGVFDVQMEPFVGHTNSIIKGQAYIRGWLARKELALRSKVVNKRVDVDRTNGSEARKSHSTTLFN